MSAADVESKVTPEKKPKKDSERVYFIAREKRQAEKMYLLD